MKQNVQKPRVPVLHIKNTEGEKILLESNDINMWLDKNFGAIEFTPQEDTPQYAEMLVWWTWCADILKPQIDVFKYGEHRVFDEDKHLVHTQELTIMLSQIEKQLNKTTWLVGDAMTLADIAIIPFVRQIQRTRDGEYDFSLFPNIQTWSEKILGELWFTDIVMKK